MTSRLVFPTPELRAAFKAEFPGEWLDLTGLKHNAMGFRESAEEAWFRRRDIEAFLAKHKCTPFELLDLFAIYRQARSGHNGCDPVYRAVQMARARWWVRQRLSITSAELQWLRTHLPELVTEAGHCPADFWDEALCTARL